MAYYPLLAPLMRTPPKSNNSSSEMQKKAKMTIDQKRASDGIWENTKADAYINSADIVVVERRRLIKILFNLYRYRFFNKKGLTLLDIGGGGGILSKYIQSKSPESTFFLLDGSYRMLEKAKQNIQGPNVFYVHQMFEEYISIESADTCYDFICSLIGDGAYPLGCKVWGDNRIALFGRSPRIWRNAITGQILQTESSLYIGDLLQHFPVAFLSGKEGV
jgi:SAM-dependent methyltransferase